MLKEAELNFYCLCAVGWYLALPYLYINTQAFCFQLPIFNLAHKFNFREFTFFSYRDYPAKRTNIKCFIFSFLLLFLLLVFKTT